ncbi:MFS transporter [archaeon]|nr:MFS transporter [archaeon]
MPNLEHNSLFRYFFNRELSAMYLSLALRFFALSMIGIFIPIYLLKEIGLSLQEVILFSLISVILFGITIFIAARLASKHGVKYIILISILFLIVSLILLNLLKYNFLHYSMPAVLIGINYGFFWIGYHIDFARFSDKKHRGKEVALADIVSVIASILGPIIGALIAVYLGFTALFVLVILFLLASVIPMFRMPDIKEHDPFSIKFMLKKGHIKYLFAFVAQGIINQTSELFWPILIFSIMQGYSGLGMVASISALAVAFSTYLAGAVSDRHTGKSTIIRIGAITYLIVWLLRAFITTNQQVVYLTIAGGIIAPLIGIPFLAKVYDRCSKENPVEFILFRELSLRIGAIIILALVLLTGSMQIGFITTALSNLLFLGM